MSGGGADGSGRSAARRAGADPAPSGSRWACSATWWGTGSASSLGQTGLALERGRLGVWLVGEQGALLVRPGGRRVDSFCVRVAEADDLPAGDRVAHLLLALREDEEGFLTVANMNFSGALWRCRLRMDRRQRPALRGAARGDSAEPPQASSALVRHQADHVALGVGEVGDPAIGISIGPISFLPPSSSALAIDPRGRSTST